MTNLHEALKTLRHQNGTTVTDDVSDQSEDEKTIAVAEEQMKTVELCPWWVSWNSWIFF